MFQLSGPARERIGAGVLLVFGLAVAARSYTYGLGTMRAVGPGLFPFLLALAIAGLSLITLLKAPSAKDAPVETFGWRIPLTIGLSVLGFAVAFVPLGLAGAIVICVVLSMLSLPRFSILLAVILSVSLAAACVLIFIWGLNLPISIFGTLGRF